MRKCNCSGHCGPQGINRREFIGLVGAGAAATLLGSPAWGAFELPADELERWRRELFAPAKPRLYLSGKHTDARMHLGGIGTGNFEIGVDGQFTTWQFFNTLRDGQVPLHFLIRAGGVDPAAPNGGRAGLAAGRADRDDGRIPGGGAALPGRGPAGGGGVDGVQPVCAAGCALLVDAAGGVRLPGQEPHQAEADGVAGGADAEPGGLRRRRGRTTRRANPGFGGNVNEVLREGGAGGLFMRAEAGGEPTLDKPVTDLCERQPEGAGRAAADRPKNLTLRFLDGQPLRVDKLDDPAHTVIWLEEPAAGTSEAWLRSAREAVQAGATLLFSGRTMPLLEAYASWTGGKPVAEVKERPDIVFEDFERGYEKWKVKGEAFGKEPAHGTLPNQNPVSGFLGQGLVNSFVGGDDTTGRLISKPFTIERRFIRFLVGGGHYANTQIRLVVGGKVVRATSGKDNEQLEPAMWDVHEFEGQTAHIEIVDEQQGGWGHINVDQIEFTDLPGSREVMVLLEELLPERVQGPSLTPGRQGRSGRAWGCSRRRGCPVASADVLEKSVGKGKVVVIERPGAGAGARGA